MRRLLLLAVTTLVTGCVDHHDPVVVRDVYPPAAPRGLYSVTGDHRVTLHWLHNTEADVAGYRIYESHCATGPGCPYELVGVTGGTTHTITGLENGTTRFFAVAAYDDDGNESDLTYEDVFDTPRPEGFDLALEDFEDAAPTSGYDFSQNRIRAWDHDETDVFFGYNGAVYQMFVPDLATDIQDAGYATSLDAVDYAPSGGWSPTGTAELIEGHCYVVWTSDDHYAKFRVTDIRPPQSGQPARVTIDWAYQVDPGNPELRPQAVKPEGRRPIYWAR